MVDTGILTGGCLCGTVRFALHPPTLFCCHCHCDWCRRAHGAAFVTWVGVPEGAFTITQGTENLAWYASSEQSSRGFCSRCGTTMLFRSKLAAGEMHVTLANLDAPVDVQPLAHTFCDARVPWVTLGDDLPRLGRDHELLAKYQLLPRSPAVERGRT
ncbi:MAG: GFA family protein [Deltaproteobacteria bacterium]|nr:GFA family protein [Deltaproteobacteria bacterium]